ncbi:unnamed protein product [Gadus morhua 'NCC']
MDLILFSKNLYCTRGSEVEVEEGELVGKKLSLHTQALARPSFAKEPHVKEVSRVFQLHPDGKLEQTLSMSTEKQPMTQHLQVTYSRLP